MSVLLFRILASVGMLICSSADAATDVNENLQSGRTVNGLTIEAKVVG